MIHGSIRILLFSSLATLGGRVIERFVEKTWLSALFAVGFIFFFFVDQKTRHFSFLAHS
jgi:hypothetical protein